MQYDKNHQVFGRLLFGTATYICIELHFVYQKSHRHQSLRTEFSLFHQFDSPIDIEVSH